MHDDSELRSAAGLKVGAARMTGTGYWRISQPNWSWDGRFQKSLSVASLW